MMALFLFFNLFLQGCASRGDGDSIGPEELLGRGVTEGRVIEGTIEQPIGRNEAAEAERLGYRVQVIASTVREEAEGVAEVVKGLFPVGVYIEYTEPFFKIRVGNFKTREEAEKMREELAGYGFEDAWIVETAIEME